MLESNMTFWFLRNGCFIEIWSIKHFCLWAGHHQMGDKCDGNIFWMLPIWLPQHSCTSFSPVFLKIIAINMLKCTFAVEAMSISWAQQMTGCHLQVCWWLKGPSCDSYNCLTFYSVNSSYIIQWFSGPQVAKWSSSVEVNGFIPVAVQAFSSLVRDKKVTTQISAPSRHV